MEKNTVTIEEVRENMQDVIVRTLDDFGKPTTYVTVKMKNGFTIRESTTCVDPENYNEEIGKNVCLKRIEDKIWFLLGYALQEKLMNTPKDYKERMKKEYDELLERTNKLSAFLKQVATTHQPDLTIMQMALLQRQEKAMKSYLIILSQRCVNEGVEIDEYND